MMDYPDRERFAITNAKRDFRKKNLVSCCTRQFEEGTGHQWIYKFPNGFGASVIFTPYSYGTEKMLYELAVIRFLSNEDYHLTYDTPITDDVLGYLSTREVCELLRTIENLEEEE
jgi:hypothetical protein